MFSFAAISKENTSVISKIIKYEVPDKSRIFFHGTRDLFLLERSLRLSLVIASN